MAPAARAGARVVAVSRRESALEVAQAMGAEYAIPLQDDPLRRIQELTRGNRCDVVIEAAGKQETLDLAGELTHVRGRLVVAGFHQDGRQMIHRATGFARAGQRKGSALRQPPDDFALRLRPGAAIP